MKKKSTIIALVVIILIIAIILVGGVVYNKTDLFSTPQQSFYKYLTSNINEGGKSYSDFLKEFKELSEKTYSSKTKVALNLQTDDSSDQKIFDEINKLGLEIETQNIPSDKKMSSNIKLTNNSKKLADLSVVKDNQKYGVKSDLLYDKYITVENKNLHKLFEKFGLSTTNIPDQIEEIDLYDLLYVSESDIKDIKNKYSDLFINLFSEDKFTKEKDVEVDVNGKSIKTNAYILTLNEKDVFEAMKKILETVKNDDKSLNLIEEKIKKLNLGDALEKKINKDTIREELEDEIEKIEDEIEYASEDEKTTITVYESKGKLAKAILKTSYDDEVIIENYLKDEKNVIKLYYKENDSIQELFMIEYKITKENNKEIAEIKSTFNYEGEKITVEYNISQSGKIGEGENIITSDISVALDEYKFKVSTNSQINYTDKVSVEGLNNKNSANINDMSVEEIQKLIEDITKNVQKNEELIDAVSELFGTKSYEPYSYTYDYELN